jgi:hypothetical protein
LLNLRSTSANGVANYDDQNDSLCIDFQHCVAKIMKSSKTSNRFYRLFLQ